MLGFVTAHWLIGLALLQILIAVFGLGAVLVLLFRRAPHPSRFLLLQVGIVLLLVIVFTSLFAIALSRQDTLYTSPRYLLTHTHDR